MAPFKLEWKSIGMKHYYFKPSSYMMQTVLIHLTEWFGNYVVGQRVANHFADPELQLFIAGDVRPINLPSIRTTIHQYHIAN